MAITILKTNGDSYDQPIRDGSANTSGALTLLGKNYSGYSQKIAENFLHLLENSASSIAPGSAGGAQGAPVSGQLWFNTSTLALSVYGAAEWQQLANLTVTPTSSAPTNTHSGDLWWDTTLNQLKGYDGSSWRTIGPATASGFLTSGPEVVSVTDSGGVTAHPVTKEYLDGTLLAIYSKDAEFTPLVAIPGFATIKPGINFSTAVSGMQLTGTASNADKLDTLDSLAFLKADGTVAATGALHINTDSGMSLGAGSDLQLTVTNGQDIEFTNQTSLGLIKIATTNNGNISLLSGTGQLLTSSSYTPSTLYSITNKSYVDTAVAAAATGLSSSTILLTTGAHTISGNLLPTTTNTVTLGNATVTFSNVYSTAFTGNLSGNVSATTIAASGAITASSLTTSAGISVGGALSVTGSTSLAGGTATVANVVPDTANVRSIGASTNKFANVWATAARVDGLYTNNLYYANGDVYSVTVGSVENATNATNATNLLVGATYRATSTSSDANTIVARDSSADIYAAVFHGISSTAAYADLAEKYQTDITYDVGTVVMVGGEQEVTAAQAGHRAIGVISEKPAYLMNESSSGQAVALKGIVPVKVLGKVAKGDRLVSSAYGVAVAVKQGHVDTFAIALESSENADIKLINATVI